jgi:phosphoglycolate phosphatase-like HAD superfamily hydrolase
VLTGGAGGRAFTRAFEDVFAVKDAFRGMPMAGRTDAWILSDALTTHGIVAPPRDLARFRSFYVRHLAEELESPGPRKGVMPGVRRLLDTLALLARPAPPEGFDSYVALLTGNYEEGARVKLEYFDLWRYFPCGAFGDDAPDRNGLLARAIAAASSCSGGSFSAQATVVIGDTPLDVECARTGGARSIGVATGSHDIDQLRSAGADVVFTDLSDTDAVMDVLRALTPTALDRLS